MSQDALNEEQFSKTKAHREMIKEWGRYEPTLRRFAQRTGLHGVCSKQDTCAHIATQGYTLDDVLDAQR
jgi:hypothetical protein